MDNSGIIFHVTRLKHMFRPVIRTRLAKTVAELQIIFTVVSVFTKENFNPFSNLISPFSIGTHEIQCCSVSF